MVALLVGLASLPTLAAITAGSHELSNGRTDTMDVPFLPPASPGPVRPRYPIGSSGLDSAEPGGESPGTGSSASASGFAAIGPSPSGSAAASAEPLPGPSASPEAPSPGPSPAG